MTIYTTDTAAATASLTIGTGNRLKDGKNYIYCEISYYDKAQKRLYHKMFPPTKYDLACQQYYALNNSTTPPNDWRFYNDHDKP